ncbi:MAG: RNA polymerase sigma factor [Fermentimonas sp.]|jgi:RNA polymerase sigma-70 factor (ECF subfamily)
MSDEQLIDKILSGDREAFRLLMEKYQQQVFQMAMGFVHSRQDAEDITQEVFIRVFRSLGSFKEQSLFSTWLYRITLNCSINYVKKYKRRNFLTGAGDSLMNLFNRGGEERNAHQQLEATEKEQAIRKAIDELPEKQRKAFILSKYEELPQREIAAIMQTSEGAVEQLLVRAKKQLQKKLAHLVGN